MYKLSSIDNTQNYVDKLWFYFNFESTNSMVFDILKLSKELKP